MTSHQFGVNIAIQFVIQFVISLKKKKEIFIQIKEMNLKILKNLPTFLSEVPQVEHLKHSTCKFFSFKRTNTPL